MRRLIALLGKEARHHTGFAVALAACLSGLYLLTLVGQIFNPENVSLMWVHPIFVWMLLIFAGPVLGNRLVVAEYYGRTQLFLEALPIRRWEMVAFKFVLGFVAMLILAGFSLGTTFLVALSREPLSHEFVGIVALRTVVFLFFGWSFLFAMGLVGRFRIPIYLLLVLMFVILDTQTELEMAHFAPIVLMDPNTLPFERETLPSAALLQTFGMGVVWTLIAFALALIHEGSVAETLSRRMSQREKALVGILVVGLVMALTFLEDNRDKQPYAFPEQQEILVSQAVPIEILYLLPERRGDAKALLETLENDLETLRLALGWSSLPVVRIAYGGSLDAHIYDQAELETSDGILVRANFQASGAWDTRDFSAYVTSLVLDEVTQGRARFEAKAWLRDGFAQWWSWRGLTGVAEPSERNEGGADLERACGAEQSALLRALWATRHETVDAQSIATWLRYRQRHGKALAEAVALSGLLVLEQEKGTDAVLDLARHVLGRVAPENALELFYEWRHPMSVVFEQAADWRWDEFLATWNAELERLRRTSTCAGALALQPEGTATVEIEAGPGTIRDVVYHYRFNSPPPAGTLTTLLHTRLPPFDSELEDDDLRRVEQFWPDQAREVTWRLPGYYGQGSRAFLALEIDSEVLGCPIRLHAERRELP